eukprot:353138-Chlamydomonas_euryale.AAC.2
MRRAGQEGRRSGWVRRGASWPGPDAEAGPSGERAVGDAQAADRPRVCGRARCGRGQRANKCSASSSWPHTRIPERGEGEGGDLCPARLGT